MTYSRTTWTNREVEKPRTYNLQDNGDGTTTLIPAEGNIISAGTPLTATNLNHIEEYLDLLSDKSEIVETGENSNGTYIRWASDYQICFGLFTFPSMTTGTAGNLHSATLPNVSFPASFLNTTYTVLPIGRFSQAVGMTIMNEGTTYFQPKIYTVSAIAGTGVSFAYYAIGRWRA